MTGLLISQVFNFFNRQLGQFRYLLRIKHAFLNEIHRNLQSLSVLAFFGGVLLAIQAGLNAHLGNLLKQPMIAVLATSFTGVVLGGALVWLLNDNHKFQHAQQVPWYLWGLGGLFSVAGIFLYYYTIPKIGISKMIALGLCGQLLFSLVAGNYGWLHMPIEPLSLKRAVGGIIMIIGVLLIQLK